MNWRFCVTDPQGRALARCYGSMDKGDGYGFGYSDGYGDGFAYGSGKGNGWGSPAATATSMAAAAAHPRSGSEKISVLKKICVQN